MEIVIYVFIFLVGIVFGSFFCCMGYRIPNKISTHKEGSFCPKCKKKLKWYMNIPLVSFIIQKGKCAYCKEKISIIYPLIELLTALLFLLSYIILGNTFNLYISIIVVSALMITFVSDFIYFYVSDRVIVVSAILILILSYSFYGLKYLLFSLCSGIVMLIVMLLIKILGNLLFKKESMGTGDIKLMGLIGISIGIVNSFYAIFIASVLAIIFVVITKKLKANEIIPFAPFLLFATLLCVYFSDFFSKLIDYLTI